MEDITITIEVDVSMNDMLIHPIKIEGKEITNLGIYIIKGLKIWVVKKCPQTIELPDNILPRHADDRENIKDLCIAVNKLSAYIKQMEA
jgi:hypothetical protein